jgi:hypothetical protein
MLRLTSGRVIDLSTDRARYHALKQYGPLPDSEHRALYPLVDIIYRRCDETGVPGRGWTEFDYVFSGHTLGNIYQAKDWSDDEKYELYQWITQNTQKLKIETARRRLVDDQNQLSVKQFSAPGFLYSRLKERLQQLPLRQATTKQWLATIINMRQSGVRQEEIIWSGLQHFLSRQPEMSRLTKQQVLEKADFSNIRLELSVEQIWGTEGGLSFKEVAQQMPHQAVYRAALKLDQSCHCILRYVDDSCNYRVGVVKTLSFGHKMSLNRYWFSLDPYGRAIINKKTGTAFYSNSSSAISAADQRASEEYGMHLGAMYHSRYDHLTLFGGYDYREWLISLPDYQRIFFGAHHFDHNVLAHVRTTTRLDQQGHKLLFIEEVQSDWHQTGQRDGYNNSCWGKVANAPFKKEWPALAAKLMLIHAGQNGFDGIAWPEGSIQETRYTRELQAIRRHYDVEIPEALNRLGKAFDCQVETLSIETRDPWLNLVKSKNKWRVTDGEGKFETRDKYHSRGEAMQVLHRHCKTIHLPVKGYLINDSLRGQLNNKGLPLFGESF